MVGPSELQEYSALWMAMRMVGMSEKALTCFQELLLGWKRYMEGERPHVEGGYETARDLAMEQTFTERCEAGGTFEEAAYSTAERLHEVNRFFRDLSPENDAMVECVNAAVNKKLAEKVRVFRETAPAGFILIEDIIRGQTGGADVSNRDIGLWLATAIFFMKDH